MSASKGVPTVEEIRKLPRWARVAFAARCARRVLPLFRHFWPTAPSAHIRAVSNAVSIAEHAAATRATRATCAAAVADADAAAAAAYDTGDDTTAADVAFAAAAAAAATRATTVADAVADEDANAAATTAADAAYAAAADEDARKLIRADLKTILNECASGGWGDNAPVPPTVFGPMWPNGVPQGWPEEDNNPSVAIPLLFAEGVSPEDVTDFQVRLHAALNKLAIANGGTGLSLDSSGAFVPTQLPKLREQS